MAEGFGGRREGFTARDPNSRLPYFSSGLLACRQILPIIA